MRVPLWGPTLSGYVIRTGEPLLIRDYDAEADRLPVPGLTAGVETASWLGVPLIVRG
jgi:GAF domain-containing protein